jgi:phosphate transporter
VTAVLVSAAMALPFSSFPNVNSMLIVDDFQSPYLTTKDFIVTGLPLSIATVIFVATFGYYLVELVME